MNSVALYAVGIHKNLIRESKREIELTFISTECSGGDHHVGEGGLHREKLHPGTSSIGYYILTTILQIVPLAGITQM